MTIAYSSSNIFGGELNKIPLFDYKSNYSCSLGMWDDWKLSYVGISITVFYILVLLFGV